MIITIVRDSDLICNKRILIVLTLPLFLSLKIPSIPTLSWVFLTCFNLFLFAWLFGLVKLRIAGHLVWESRPLKDF